MPAQPELRRPQVAAQVPVGLREVLVREAPALLEHRDAVALLGQPQRRHAAAEARPDDDSRSRADGRSPPSAQKLPGQGDGVNHVIVDPPARAPGEPLRSAAPWQPAPSSACAPRWSARAGACGTSGRAAAAQLRRRRPRAGAIALMLAPDERAGRRRPTSCSTSSTGCILAGGADIDPAAYGAERHPETVDTGPRARRVRDRARAPGARARPAAARHLPRHAAHERRPRRHAAAAPARALGHHEHRAQPGSFDGADHDVRLTPGSLAARAAGESTHGTKSHHHQGVDRVGEGFEVTGWSTIDELPEAIELPGARFALGVQWHPEADERSRADRRRSWRPRVPSQPLRPAARRPRRSRPARRSAGPATPNATRAGGSVAKNGRRPR